MRLRNLQWRAERRVQMNYLIPRLELPEDYLVESVSRYWWLTQRKGNS